MTETRPVEIVGGPDDGKVVAVPLGEEWLNVAVVTPPSVRRFEGLDYTEFFTIKVITLPIEDCGDRSVVRFRYQP